MGGIEHHVCAAVAQELGEGFFREAACLDDDAVRHDAEQAGAGFGRVTVA